MRAMLAVAWTVMIEAVRRKEIYAIVLFSCALIAAIGSIRFFDVPGLGKFYFDVALKVMNLATALTVIVLAARQLPREFERRTIYPLLARPVHRWQFLLGKFAGVMAAGAFCFLLFGVILIGGALYLGASLDAGLLAQHALLQMMALAVVASLAFCLSLMGNLDMAITVSALVVFLAQILTSFITYAYHFVGPVGRLGVKALNLLIPQLTLFDLSQKIVHGGQWPPVKIWVIGALGLYAAAYVVAFLSLGYLLFRRRPL